MLAPRDGQRVGHSPWLPACAGSIQASVSQITDAHSTQLVKGAYRVREMKLARQLSVIQQLTRGHVRVIRLASPTDEER